MIENQNNVWILLLYNVYVKFLVTWERFVYIRRKQTLSIFTVNNNW